MKKNKRLKRYRLKWINYNKNSTIQIADLLLLESSNASVVELTSLAKTILQDPVFKEYFMRLSLKEPRDIDYIG